MQASVIRPLTDSLLTAPATAPEKRMPDMDDLVQRNAAAVAAMRSSDHGEATRILNGALKQLQAPHDDDSLAACANNCRHRSTTASQFVLATVTITKQCPEDEITSEVYDRAFLLPCRGASVPCVAAVLFFNSGLAFHRHAMEPTCASSAAKALKKALYLYRQAHRMAELVDDKAELDGIAVFLAAVYHNMRQIHATFMNLREADYLRKRLERVFTLRSAGLMNDHDYAFFHMQLLLGQTDPYTLAPAA